jgi:hypothetical protein
MAKEYPFTLDPFQQTSIACLVRCRVQCCDGALMQCCPSCPSAAATARGRPSRLQYVGICVDCHFAAAGGQASARDHKQTAGCVTQTTPCHPDC